MHCVCPGLVLLLQVVTVEGGCNGARLVSGMTGETTCCCSFRTDGTSRATRVYFACFSGAKDMLWGMTPCGPPFSAGTTLVGCSTPAFCYSFQHSVCSEYVPPFQAPHTGPEFLRLRTACIRFIRRPRMHATEPADSIEVERLFPERRDVFSPCELCYIDSADLAADKALPDDRCDWSRLTG